MEDSRITPLSYPAVWPPPEVPAFPARQRHRIPLLGPLLAYLARLRHSFKHLHDTHDPIAQEIVDHLTARTPHGTWPTTGNEQVIAKIVSEAVCLEKGLIRPPALHPNDPYPLLFWGSYDDLTPMIFRMKFNNHFHRELPVNLPHRAWNERWTIETFVTACAECVQSRSMDTSGNWS